MPVLTAWRVKGLEIKDATVVWQDDVSQTKAKLDQFNVLSGAIVLDEFTPVELSAHAQLSDPEADIKLTLKTRIKLSRDNMCLALSDLALQLQAQTPDLSVQHATIKLNASLNGRLNEQQFKLQNVLLAVDAKGEALPGGELAVTFKTAANIDVKKQTLNIKSLQINTLGVVMQADVSVSQMLDAPVIKGRVEINEFNPSLLPSQLGIELPVMRDPNVLQKAQMQFNYQASASMARLDAIQITLDDSELKGWLHVKDFNQPALVYQLNLNKMNLDRYLPPAAETEKTGKREVKPQNEDIAITLPVELLRNINVHGVLGANEILIADQKINNLNIKTMAEQGIVRINPLTANVLKGHVALTAKLDVRPARPKYAIDLNANGLHVAPMVNPVLKSLLGDESLTVDGAINLTAHIKAQGNSVNALKSALNGNVNFNVGEAQLKGLDVSYFGKKVVVDYLKKTNKDKITPQDWPGEYKPKTTTAFKIMRASAVVRNGIVNNTDLLLDSKRIKVTGAGQIDLPQSKINYHMVVDVQPTRLKTAAEKLLDIPIPVIAKGPFSQLQIEPDMNAWSKLATKALKKEVKTEVKKKLEEKKVKAVEKIKKKYGDQLKNKLEGLFR